MLGYLQRPWALLAATCRSGADWLLAPARALTNNLAAASMADHLAPVAEAAAAVGAAVVAGDLPVAALREGAAACFSLPVRVVP